MRCCPSRPAGDLHLHFPHLSTDPLLVIEQLRLGFRLYSGKKDSSGCFSSSQADEFKKLRPGSSLIMHRFPGNRAKKEEYKRTSPYPYPCVKLQANQQGRNTSIGKLCCQPYLMKGCLILDTSADPSYCIITQEVQIFMQSLTFRNMKYSPTRNCPENHVTRLTLHFQIKYFLVRQYRP